MPTLTMNTRRSVLALALMPWAPAFAADHEAEFKQLERLTGGRIGLYAQNLDTGAKIAWRADERFLMCSTFKASLAAAVLQRVDRGQEHLDRQISCGPADLEEYAPTTKAALGSKATRNALDQNARASMSVEALCKAAVELSDNTAANLLLKSIGGPPALTAFWRGEGDQVSRLDRTEPELNRAIPGSASDTTTPAAIAGTLRRLVLGKTLSDASREKLTDWLIGCQTGANRLRAGLPKGWMIGDKTGNNGHDAFGDIAVAWAAPGKPIVACAFTQEGSPKPADVDAVYLQLGKMVGRLG